MRTVACMCTLVLPVLSAQQPVTQRSPLTEAAAEVATQAATQSAAEPSFAFLSTPPTGLPAMPLPADYQPNEAMFELGRRLFHDGVLSRDRSVSCATCHPAATGFAHPDPRPQGVDGRRALRHAPTLWNRGYGTLQRWDGSSPSLEVFVLEPIADANEMALPIAEALQRLAADDSYRVQFEAAFGEAARQSEVDRRELARALATFVRGIVAGDAAYDRFVRGDAKALTPEQRTGQWLFESKGGCWRCHTPPLFTDERFHNTGAGLRDGRADPGRARVTGEAAHTGQFRTPTLRRVVLSAPYMHDGSLADLPAVVDFYAAGGGANEHLDTDVKPLALTPAERAALVAFLQSL